MKRTAILLVLGLAAASGATLAVRAQEDGERRGVSVIGRYHPGNPAGVLDTFSGATYCVDPEDSTQVVTLDLVHARAFVRAVGKDASGWGAVDLQKLDPSVVPAMHERAFVATHNPFEVLDTKTGALYSLEAPPKTRVADWKGVKVVRTDPVLGVRGARELQVSKRGG